jgi:very-short-patch-repair endonuclease
VASEASRVGASQMANKVARKLRKSLTPQEVKIWNHLRSWRKRGFHFRRQAPRKGYVVDFVCLKHGLVVEIDGGQHNFDDHAQADAGRATSCRIQGFGCCDSGTTKSIEIWQVFCKRSTARSRKLYPTRPRVNARGRPPPAGEG